MIILLIADVNIHNLSKMRWPERVTNFLYRRRNFCTKCEKLKPPWNVLFFGTDEFSLSTLKALHNERSVNKTLIKKLEVVTNKHNNLIRKYAESKSLITHNWPFQVPLGAFHLGLVVSFGHLLPKEVIDSFPMGMLNVHASLLPRWRGAAPIIYALMHGDEKTGVTIMRIRPGKFDIGEIVKQEEVAISKDVKMLDLHQHLAEIGAKNLVETIRDLPGILDVVKNQNEEGVSYAPRVKPSLAIVDFNKTCKEVYNLSRALTGLYPLATNWNGIPVKFHSIVKYEEHNDCIPGKAFYIKSLKLLKVECADGSVFVDRIGVQNKKIMNALEFNNGYLKKHDESNRMFR